MEKFMLNRGKRLYKARFFWYIKRQLFPLNFLQEVVLMSALTDLIYAGSNAVAGLT